MNSTSARTGPKLAGQACDVVQKVERMTDKQAIIISWFFVLLSIPALAWNVDAGMVMSVIAAVIRWDELKRFNDSVGKSKNPYWICSFVYLVLLATIYLLLKLKGIGGKNNINSEFKWLTIMLFLPFVPRMIKHDYTRRNI